MLKNIKSALIKKESLKSTKTYELKLSDLTSYKKKKEKSLRWVFQFTLFWSNVAYLCKTESSVTV